MKFNQKNLFIAAFILMLLLPLIFSDKAGGEVSKRENRILAKFPVLSFRSGSFSEFRDGFEDWINDNAGFRSASQKIKANLDYKLLRSSSSESVFLGADGWFFITYDHNLDIAAGTYPMTAAMLEEIRKSQLKIQREFKRQGIDYVICLVPSKASIYPEFIGDENYDARETVIDIVSEMLRMSTTVPVINLKPALLSAKENAQVFYKTDTHWNDAGAYQGYRSLIKELNRLGYLDSAPIEIKTRDATHLGDMSTLMGDEKLLPPEDFKQTIIFDPNAREILSGATYSKLSAIREENQLPDVSLYSNPEEKKTALIFGDSFFGMWQIRSLLAEHFSRTVFAWSPVILPELIDLVQPDIVIFERTERNLDHLSDSDDAL